MKVPCGECPKAGCGSYHDKCEQYQEYRKSKEREYVRKKIVNTMEHDLNEIERRRMSRSKQSR